MKEKKKILKIARNKKQRHVIIIRVTGNVLLIRFKCVYPVCEKKAPHFRFH